MSQCDTAPDGATDTDARRLEILASVNPAAVGRQLADACHWAAAELAAQWEAELADTAGPRLIREPDVAIYLGCTAADATIAVCDGTLGETYHRAVRASDALQAEIGALIKPAAASVAARGAAASVAAGDTAGAPRFAAGDTVRLIGDFLPMTIERLDVIDGQGIPLAWCASTSRYRTPRIFVPITCLVRFWTGEEPAQ